MEMKQPTLQQFQKWAKDCRPAAVAVCQAQAFAELERERVDAYILPLFKGWKFEYSAKYGDKAGQLIPSPERLYLCDDEGGIAAFYAECDEAHRAHGFKGPRGHCPALTAEALHVAVENALIGLAKPLFGIDVCDLSLDQRTKYLDLLLGACIKSDQRVAA